MEQKIIISKIDQSCEALERKTICPRDYIYPSPVLNPTADKVDRAFRCLREHSSNISIFHYLSDNEKLTSEEIGKVQNIVISLEIVILVEYC